MLEAGYLGVRRLSCDEAMDPDERDRWDRAMKSRDTTITEVTKKNDELTRKVAELEAKLGGVRPGSGVFGGCVFPLAQPLAPKTPDPGQSHESENAQTTPVVNKTSPAPEVASPIQKAPCGDMPATRQPVSQRVNQVNQEHPSGRPGTSRRQQQSPRFSQMRPVPPPLGEEN